MPQLEFEVLLDDPDAGRIVRAGNWVHTTMYDENGCLAVCQWDWEPLLEAHTAPKEQTN